MTRFISALLFSLFSFNLSASLLPQADSNGEDGLLFIDTSATLFADADNIYNFTDFVIDNNGTLQITSSAEIFIYSQQSITIDGNIIADTAGLNFIAPSILVNGSLQVNSDLSFYTTDSGSSTFPDLSNALITSDTDGASLTRAIIFGEDLNNELITLGQIELISTNHLVITPPSPVPVPAAIWLLASGLVSLGLFTRKPRNPANS